MRKTGILTFVFLVISSTFGCGSASTNANAAASSAPATEKPSTLKETNAADTTTDQKASSYAASNTAAKAISVGRAVKKVIDTSSLSQAQTALTDTSPTDRKIVRNADLSLEAESPEEAQRHITSIAEANGGFVVESQQTSSDIRTAKRDIITMSVRVPSQKFADTLDQIHQTSDKIIFETVKGDDVTEEFIDIEARLKAKKALEQQFVEIMKRAYSVDDAMNVESELAEVRGDIEKVEGRKRFLENQSSLSTIKVKLQTPAAAFSASSKGYSERLEQSFGTGFDFALSFIFGLVTLVIGILPFAVFIGLPLVLVVRYFLKRQSRSRTIIELAEDELKAT